MLESAVVLRQSSASTGITRIFLPTSEPAVALLPVFTDYRRHRPCRKEDPSLIGARTRIAGLHVMFDSIYVLASEIYFRRFLMLGVEERC